MKAVTLEDEFVYSYLIVIMLLVLKDLKGDYIQNCFEKK